MRSFFNHCHNPDPAHDLQAMDRAYRFGQTRDVSVYRLLGAGSIEELIYARQVYKQQQMAVGYDASLQTRWVYLYPMSCRDISRFRVLFLKVFRRSAR